MNLRQSHVLVSQPLLKIRGANLKLKNPRFIANISPGNFRAVLNCMYISRWGFSLFLITKKLILCANQFQKLFLTSMFCAVCNDISPGLFP